MTDLKTNFPLPIWMQLFVCLFHYLMGPVLVYDFWTPPPPPNLFFIIFYSKVRSKQFLGRALRLGQANGPSSAAKGPALRPHDQFYKCKKLIGGGKGEGECKRNSQGNYHLMIYELCNTYTIDRRR